MLKLALESSCNQRTFKSNPVGLVLYAAAPVRGVAIHPADPRHLVHKREERLTAAYVLLVVRYYIPAVRGGQQLRPRGS